MVAAYTSGAVQAPAERQALRGSDAKSDMLLVNLQQHTGGRVPSYTGHKPRSAVNMTA